MTIRNRASLEEIRAFHAKMMAAASNSDDERLQQVFERVPREAFLGPGPWQIRVNRRYMDTLSSDPAYLYQNVLVALDANKGINNGEPFLHAALIGAAAPKPGDTVIHVGAGTGYYTALLSLLVQPGGEVHAFEIDEALAARARENLKDYEGVTVIRDDATTAALPEAGLIYVNAGVIALPLAWIAALRPGGRLIFPWQANARTGLALCVTRTGETFSVRPVSPAWFIPCIGASDGSACLKAPGAAEAWSARSLWLTGTRPPDETAVAIYKDYWLSSAGGEEIGLGESV